MSKHLVRSIKNISYSPAEVKVRNLTSNDPYGPSGADLNDVSKMTFQKDKLRDVIKILNKRLSTKKNSALHILKSLTIIQFCLQVGSQNFVDYYKIHQELVINVTEFAILNKKDRDGSNVRKRARYILKLLRDDNLLKEKRENFHSLRSDMLIPGIKSTAADKNEHMRYSLDQRPVDVVEAEVMPSNGMALRSSSLDLERLNYYKQNNKDSLSDDIKTSKHILQLIKEEDQPVHKLQMIREETSDSHDLQRKINQLTKNPFRNSVFVEDLSLSGTSSNNSSTGSSLNDHERKSGNPFIS